MAKILRFPMSCVSRIEKKVIKKLSRELKPEGADRGSFRYEWVFGYYSGRKFVLWF